MLFYLHRDMFHHIFLYIHHILFIRTYHTPHTQHRFFKSQYSRRPVSYTHLDVYKRQGGDHVTHSISSLSHFAEKEDPVKADTLTTVTGLSTKNDKARGGSRRIGYTGSRHASRKNLRLLIAKAQTYADPRWTHTWCRWSGQGRLIPASRKLVRARGGDWE